VRCAPGTRRTDGHRRHPRGDRTGRNQRAAVRTAARWRWRPFGGAPGHRRFVEGVWHVDSVGSVGRLERQARFLGLTTRRSVPQHQGRSTWRHLLRIGNRTRGGAAGVVPRPRGGGGEACVFPALCGSV